MKLGASLWPSSSLLSLNLSTDVGTEWITSKKRPTRYTDHDETREVQEKRIKYFTRNGDQHFTNDGRRAEITIDLVLQAKAIMSENKVNGPEDAVVGEMIKQLPQEKFYIITKCFQERFMGQ